MNRNFIVILLLIIHSTALFSDDKIKSKIEYLFEQAPASIGIAYEDSYNTIIKKIGRPLNESKREIENNQYKNTKDIIYTLTYKYYEIELYESKSFDKHFITSITISNESIILPYNIHVGCSREYIKKILGTPNTNYLISYKYFTKDYAYNDITFKFGFTELNKIIILYGLD